MFYLYTYWMNRWPLKYTGSLSFPFDKFVYYLFSLSLFNSNNSYSKSNI